MRLHPLAAACLAVLLCAATASCARAEDATEDTETPSGAAVNPEPEEADEVSPPPREPEREWPYGTPVGWAAEPRAVEAATPDDGADTGEEDGSDGDDEPSDTADATDGASGTAPEEDEDQARDSEEIEGPSEHPGVTGGAGGETVTATDADSLAEYLGSDAPLVVEVEGHIDLDGTISVGSDKTLLGAGEGAELTDGGLDVDGSANVIIANVAMAVDTTAIAVHGGAHHVWVDGSTFTGGDGEALVSITDGADHVTLSWNHFSDAEAAVAIGATDDEAGALRVSVHHNFFDGTTSRHPSARNAAHVHVFNNYFRDNPDYGVSSTHGSQVLVEGNYFERTPMSAPTEVDDPGDIVTRDNLLVDSAQPEPRGEVSDPPYAYELDDTVSVPDLVSGRAGAL
ncbi:right-handed parallel beta-helix repeat-containing protein [Nocardiopsis sp. MG754419]|uniref:pectate lyase family protein n=1 Tax=Nocardiopsis sp. MG754419 TaxID=2259865 RepID=UPI001BA50F70|nr:right-handed parallel beta-helix repeat-containing protein [Nocardiopsis sp. MG754419]MBR8745137.1 pectate lyase [Nocardiopsis sp. MG754419]